MDSKPYVKLVKGYLTLPSSVTEFNGLYTILGKTDLLNMPSCSVYNSRKNQPYT